MSSPKKHRVVVGLSGGVDSAVTAHLLKAQGHEVIGIFMKNWEDDDDDEYCSTRQDFLDAASVADVLGIEIEHVNFAAEPLSHDASRELDEGIVQALWMTPAELQEQRARHRSPLVWQVVQDYLAGRRSPLSTLQQIA